MNIFTKYTAGVRQLLFNFPVLSAISKQVIFWIIALQLLGSILYFNGMASGLMYESAISNTYLPAMLTWLMVGFFYGVLLGLSDFYMYRRWSRGRSLGIIIIVKGVFYFSAMMLIFIFIRFVVWNYFLKDYYAPQNNGEELKEQVWNIYFYILAIYTLAMSILISFIININKKFGPGVLVPLLLGKYTSPVIEQRAFMFLDLKSSTTLAEALGHVKYSELIKDCFQEFNDVTIPYRAEIYQYVGDEIVLSWPVSKDMDFTKCVDFYFACKAALTSKSKHYLDKYNVVPEFKAGLHYGMVTGVEVGDIKREVAYHGDTLNIAARIQALCNDNDAELSISDAIKPSIANDKRYKCTLIGDTILKGKSEEVTVYKVSQHEK